MKKIYILTIFSIVLFVPLLVNAETLKKVSYEKANIYFEIDSDAWTESESDSETKYVDRNWTSNCGELSTGSYDLYGELSEEEKEGLSRRKQQASNDS